MIHKIQSSALVYSLAAVGLATQLYCVAQSIEPSAKRGPEHRHDHPAAVNSITLSPQAQANIGLQQAPVTLIAHDGDLYPDTVIAMSNAQQMQTAFKNLSGGAHDPHANHNHN